MFKKIFKNIDGKWKKINLNEEAKKYPRVNFSSPKKCNKWIQELHKKYGTNFSYGGFLEDRSFIWKDHYNVKQGNFIHEGEDFNVPKGTEVFLFEDGEVIEIIKDIKMFGGWGNAVVFWIPKIKKYVIHAHLDKKLYVSQGQKYLKGQKIGTIGGPSQNGHYFPHLHLQVMDKDFAKQYKKFFDVDGYSKKNSKILKHLYHPAKFVK
jgi:murein DD-endopeptidase MepM/ murein hydrolase activator NlpD